MRSTSLLSTDGREAAQHLRLALSELWSTVGTDVIDEVFRRDLCSSMGPGWLSTYEDLVAAGHCAIGFSRRIHSVLEEPDRLVELAVPFLPLPTPPGPEQPPIEVILIRTSRDIESLAQLLEPLQVSHHRLRWQAPWGVETLGDLVTEAIRATDGHLQAAALSARLLAERAVGTLAQRPRRDEIVVPIGASQVGGATRERPPGPPRGNGGPGPNSHLGRVAGF